MRQQRPYGGKNLLHLSKPQPRVKEKRDLGFTLYCEGFDLKTIAEHPQIQRSVATIRNWSGLGCWKLRREKERSA